MKNNNLVPWPFIMSFILLLVKVLWVPGLSWWIVALPMLLMSGIIVSVLGIMLVVAIVVAIYGDK